MVRLQGSAAEGVCEEDRRVAQPHAGIRPTVSHPILGVGGDSFDRKPVVRWHWCCIEVYVSGVTGRGRWLRGMVWQAFHRLAARAVC